MKKLSIALSLSVLFAGMSVASPIIIQQKSTEKAEKKAEKKPEKKEVKKVPPRNNKKGK